MFKEMGSLMSLMKNLPKLQAQAAEFQAKVDQITAEGSSGAGLVTAKANGKMQLLSIRISPEAHADRELLEDLIASAVNNAFDKVRAQLAEQTGKMAEGMGLPPGMSLPGLS